jgi:hypothetical protein
VCSPVAIRSPARDLQCLLWTLACGCAAMRKALERGYDYYPSRHSAGQPIGACWACQFIAQLSFERVSWVAPMDLRRLHPNENQNKLATEQVRALVDRSVTEGAVLPTNGGYKASQCCTGG